MVSKLLSYLFYRKLYVTSENKNVIRELLEDILQIDADIQMPDIPESASSKKRNSLNDKDGDQDPDGDSTSGSPPPSKQPKQDPDTQRDNQNDNGNSENGEHGSENGFENENPGEFRQNSMKIKPVNNKSNPSTNNTSFCFIFSIQFLTIGMLHLIIFLDICHIFLFFFHGFDTIFIEFIAAGYSVFWIILKC